MKKLKQIFCRHLWKCIYIYNINAEWQCVKCEKHKKGYAPMGLSNEDIASKWYDDFFTNKINKK